MADFVQRGQRIKADHINALYRGLDVAGQKRADTLLPGKSGLVIMKAVNVGAATLNPWHCAVVTAQGYDPLTSLQRRGLGLQVCAASEGYDPTFFVVCLEPIAPGRSGRVCMSGMTWAAADATTTGAYARLEIDKTILTLGESGTAAVLSGSGNPFVLIRFPIGGGMGDVSDPWTFFGGW